MAQKKLNKILTSIVFLLALCTTTAAQDLTGAWQGRFRTDQRLNGASKTFFMNMMLTQHGRKIEGRFGNAPLDFPDRPEVVYEISGIIRKKATIPAHLMRGRILYSKLIDEVAEYFLSLDEIQYFRNDTMEVLYGNWTATGLIPLRSDGYAGSFWVSRLRAKDSVKNNNSSDTGLVHRASGIMIKDTAVLLIPDEMAKREKSEQAHITVNSKKISLQIYDNGDTDGDSVSIFFNGRLLMSHQVVSEKPITLELELDLNTPKNEIILFAENLGSIPPNTALVIVNAGNKRYELFSNADLKKNAVLIIEYHQSSE